MSLIVLILNEADCISSNRGFAFISLSSLHFVFLFSRSHLDLSLVSFEQDNSSSSSTITTQLSFPQCATLFEHDSMFVNTVLVGSSPL
jgi:hypothetical protein